VAAVSAENPAELLLSDQVVVRGKVVVVDGNYGCESPKCADPK
jgi:flagellar motor switch/type III secretory pathway protein FliN